MGYSQLQNIIRHGLEIFKLNLWYNKRLRLNWTKNRWAIKDQDRLRYDAKLVNEWALFSCEMTYKLILAHHIMQAYNQVVYYRAINVVHDKCSFFLCFFPLNPFHTTHIDVVQSYHENRHFQPCLLWNSNKRVASYYEWFKK